MSYWLVFKVMGFMVTLELGGIFALDGFPSTAIAGHFSLLFERKGEVVENLKYDYSSETKKVTLQVGSARGSCVTLGGKLLHVIFYMLTQVQDSQTTAQRNPVSQGLIHFNQYSSMYAGSSRSYFIYFDEV